MAFDGVAEVRPVVNVPEDRPLRSWSEIRGAFPHMHVVVQDAEHPDTVSLGEPPILRGRVIAASKDVRLLLAMVRGMGIECPFVVHTDFENLRNPAY